jgi:F0F1-type ATP synthase assembly protein I
MSTRREPEQNRLEKIGARVRQRALTGSEASTVGFTLVVFIFAGAGLGYLLDTNLETSYWIAIGTLLGAVVGFRQMFALTKKLTRESALDDADEERPQQETTVAENEHPTPNKAGEKLSEEKPLPKRLFSAEIPPPPTPSFDVKPEKSDAEISDNKSNDTKGHAE